MKLALSEDKLEAHLVIQDEDKGNLTESLVFDLLLEKGVVEGIQESSIKRHLEKLKNGELEETKFLAASGKKPVEGRPARFKFLLEENTGVNKYTADSPYFNVQQGQEIWEMEKMIPGISGKTVLGEILSVPETGETVPKFNENIISEERGEKVFFRSKGEGVYITKDNQWTVVKELKLKEIGPDTGNLDVCVPVEVLGSVLAGFFIHTTKSILIHGAIEENANLNAGGDIEIKGGVLGVSSLIKSGGSFKAKFVQGGKIFAKGKITIESHFYSGLLHSLNEVEVIRSKKEKSNVLSGMIVARNNISLGDVGSPGRNEVDLHIGYDPILKTLNKNKAELEKTLQLQSVKLTRVFGVSLKSSKLLEVINTLPVSKRKTVIAQLNTLKKLTQKIKELNERISICGGDAFTENQEGAIHLSGNVFGKINAWVLGQKTSLKEGASIRITLDQDKNKVKICRDKNKEIA